MQTTKFYKMSGAGNTFVIHFGQISDFFSPRDILNQKHREFIKKLCSKEWAHVDGALFLEKKSDLNYKWDFYNNDGSTAEMCGNAARCATFLVNQEFPTKDNLIEFETLAGLVVGEVSISSEVIVLMPTPKVKDKDFKTQADQYVGHYFFIDTGVPHIVVKSENLLNTLDLKKIGKLLRWAPELGIKGSNVTFYSVRGLNDIQAVTYERGVEDLTQACGTGAVAAAIAYLFTQENFADVRVEMPGGSLKVKTEEKTLKTWMIGPAEVSNILEYNIEDLK